MNKSKNKQFYPIAIITIFISISFFGCSTENRSTHDPHRFDEEIKKIASLPVPEGDALAVFTGSSSIRIWEDIKKDCSRVPLVNTGFGGSHMSDLLFFIEQTVLRFQPDKVFIYEGDNDISAEKSPDAILKTSKQVANKILKSNPDITIHFISAKPSPSRWQYKEEYMTFNALLKNYCADNPQLFYVDVWGKMLDDSGRPDPTIFISDSLHMNRKGYLLWKDIVCEDFKVKSNFE